MQPLTMECVRRWDRSLIGKSVGEIMSHLRLVSFNHQDTKTVLSDMAIELGVPHGEFSSYVYLLVVAREFGGTFDETPPLKEVWGQVMPHVPFKVFEEYFMALCQKVYEQNLETEESDEFYRYGQNVWGESQLSPQEIGDLLLDLQEDAVFDGDLP